MFFRQLHINQRFYLIATSLFVLFCAAFFVKWLFWAGAVFLCAFVLLTLADIILLFAMKNPVSAERSMQPFLSLGDDNTITLRIENKSILPLSVRLIEELPAQFQKRDFLIKDKLKSFEVKKHFYNVKPLHRGIYEFGFCNVLLATPLQLFLRKFSASAPHSVPVYPSVIQMKQFQLYTLEKLSHYYGIKKLRRTGHSYDFEQIKEYVRGDDVRSINWKATGRRASLMVNHYQEERSQQVYCLIDKGRTMLMPFGGLSLMDYAINASLVISNVALQKGDKTGLLTFSDKIGSAVKADSGKGQLRRIMETLYSQKERETESDYRLLLYSIQKMIPSRSLLFLFTNFESRYALDRVLPVLRKLNQSHLLVAVFFENDEISDCAHSDPATSIDKIFMKTIAEEFIMDKLKIRQELLNLGIQCILTKPSELTINTLNKYLELKARGMI